MRRVDAFVKENQQLLYYATYNSKIPEVDENGDFTRSITTTDMSLPIDEFSLIWFETKPALLSDGTADPDSADYTVAAPVARSFNSLMIAIKKRKKSTI